MEFWVIESIWQEYYGGGFERKISRATRIKYDLTWQVDISQVDLVDLTLRSTLSPSVCLRSVCLSIRVCLSISRSVFLCVCLFLSMLADGSSLHNRLMQERSQYGNAFIWCYWSRYPPPHYAPIIWCPDAQCSTKQRYRRIFSKTANYRPEFE